MTFCSGTAFGPVQKIRFSTDIMIIKTQQLFIKENKLYSPVLQ